VKVAVICPLLKPGFHSTQANASISASTRIKNFLFSCACAYDCVRLCCVKTEHYACAYACVLYSSNVRRQVFLLLTIYILAVEEKKRTTLNLTDPCAHLFKHQARKMIPNIEAQYHIFAALAEVYF